MVLGEPIKDFDIYFKTKECVEEVAKYYVAKFNELNKGKTPHKPFVKLDTIINSKGVDEERVLIWIQSDGIVAENNSVDILGIHPSELDNEMGEEYIPEYNLGIQTSEIDLNENESKDTKGKYRPVFLSQNAITLSDKIQIVIRFYGDPEEIHENYDFVHCTNWYDYKNNHVELRQQALESLMCKQLYYVGSLYPVCSIFRLRKFIERGWKISAGEMLKIVWQCSELDLNDINVLKEQLTGVDALYFFKFLDIIKDIKNDDPEKGINSTYVATIIDRVFNS